MQSGECPAASPVCTRCVDLDKPLTGKTGRLAVEGLLKRGKAVRAVTRTGEFSFKQSSDSNGGALSTTAGDVTKLDTLKEALAGCGAVLFCASASKVQMNMSRA